MTEQTIQNYDEDEISFLDILVTLAESWKLLVFGPLIAGVLAGGLSFLLPKTFESVAIVRMTEEEVALLHAAPVLDPLIEKFGLLAKADGILDDARQDLKKRLFFAVDKKTKLVTINAKAGTPEDAQALSSGAIAEMLKELQVKGREKELLEKTIAINDRAIENAEDAMESIQRTMKKRALFDQEQESTIKNLAAINSDIANRSQENEVLRNKMKAKGEEIFIQKPSLPQFKTFPKLGPAFTGSFFLSGLFILIYIFIRKAITNAERNVDKARKISTIKSLLLCKRI